MAEAVVLSFEELKKQNEAEEKAALEKEKQQEVEADAEREAAADEAVEEFDAKKKPTEEKIEEEPEKPEADAESEDWMRGDDEEEGAEKPEAKFTDGDVAKLRRKMKARIKETESEVEVLRKQVEELKKQPAPVAVKPDAEPDRDKYATDAEYQVALAQWATKATLAQQEAEHRQQQQQAANAQKLAKLAEAVDDHLARAVVMAKQSKIDPEDFKQAELRVRQSIEAIRPGAGDVITDVLIARLGKGSEKVIYSLGVSDKRLKGLVEALQDDPDGFAAFSYLKDLQHKFNAVKEKETEAPEPPEQVRGDKKGATGTGAKMLRDYRAAHAKGDTQAAIDIKFKAKAAGIKTQDW